LARTSEKSGSPCAYTPGPINMPGDLVARCLVQQNPEWINPPPPNRPAATRLITTRSRTSARLHRMKGFCGPITGSHRSRHRSCGQRQPPSGGITSGMKTEPVKRKCAGDQRSPPSGVFGVASSQRNPRGHGVNRSHGFDPHREPRPRSEQLFDATSRGRPCVFAPPAAHKATEVCQTNQLHGRSKTPRSECRDPRGRDRRSGAPSA